MTGRRFEACYVILAKMQNIGEHKMLQFCQKIGFSWLDLQVRCEFVFGWL